MTVKEEEIRRRNGKHRSIIGIGFESVRDISEQKWILSTIFKYILKVLQMKFILWALSIYYNSIIVGRKWSVVLKELLIMPKS